MEALGKKQHWDGTDGRYVYWSRGKGPLVVLLHGWPVSSFHWRYLCPFLDSLGFETLAIDLKGLGESSYFDMVFEKEKLANSLLALLSNERRDDRPFSLVGHDWGGSIAIAMAAIVPRRVSKLVIEEELAPGLEVPLEGQGQTRYPSWHGAFHRSVGLPEDLLKGKEDRYIGFFLDLRHDTASLSKDDRETYLKLYRSEKKTVAGMAYYRTLSADRVFFQSIETKKLRLPSLALGGVSAMGSSVGASLSKIALPVTSELFDRSGHYPAEEEPEKFNAVVAEFLKNSSPS